MQTLVFNTTTKTPKPQNPKTPDIWLIIILYKNDKKYEQNNKLIKSNTIYFSKIEMF